MKLESNDIRRIEKLADFWQVEMPQENFFANLSAMVLERASEQPKTWWLEVLVPAGAVAAMIIILGLGLGLQISRMAGEQRLARAAVSWLSEGEDWENIDRIIGEARELNISGLHRYLDHHSLVEASTALEGETEVLAYSSDDINQ